MEIILREILQLLNGYAIPPEHRVTKNGQACYKMKEEQPQEK